MINPIVSNTFRFLFLALLQVVVLNNVGLFNLFNPYLYILFIILLPFETAPFFVLLFSFLLGLSIDTFSSTDGMHTKPVLLFHLSDP
jgi:rod shape-determining protein MreD